MSFNDLLYHFFIYTSIVTIIMIVFGYLTRIIDNDDV